MLFHEMFPTIGRKTAYGYLPISLPNFVPSVETHGKELISAQKKLLINAITADSQADSEILNTRIIPDPPNTFFLNTYSAP